MNSDANIDLTDATACPVPMSDYQEILLGHGSGGHLSQQLLRNIILPRFDNEMLHSLHDGATISMNGLRLAFSTDSYVVQPIFFPGGDIGSLAVHGTVNDLAMCGAIPKYLSVGFIIEEGFSIEEFTRVVESMRRAAERAGVEIVTGDTKVVDRGKGDKIFINTTGVGIVRVGLDISPVRATPGDKILLSGSIGQHGIAIMSTRDGLEFSSLVESDTAPLHDLVATMVDASKNIHVLRDPTRGGVASVLNEIAASSRTGISIVETDIPVCEEVEAACEILGLDPLYVANEGKLIAVVPAEDAERVLAAMKNHPLGIESAIIGEVVDDHLGLVVMRTRVGGNRIVDLLSGEQLPRIC